MSNRPDLDEEQIGATKCKIEGHVAIPFIGTWVRIRTDKKVCWVRPQVIAATDGHIIPFENFFPLPFVLDKVFVRQHTSAFIRTHTTMLKQPRFKEFNCAQGIRGDQHETLKRFVTQHSVSYLKPAGATGHGRFVTRLCTTNQHHISIESSDEQVKQGQLIPKEKLKIWLNSYVQAMRHAKRTPFLILEQGIKTCTYANKKVDVRFIVQWDVPSQRYTCTSDYAKVGNEISATFSNGGKALNTKELLKFFVKRYKIESNLSKIRKTLQKEAELLVRYIFNEAYNQKDQKTYRKPLLASIDVAFSKDEKTKTLVPWLIELNCGPVQFLGLKECDLEAYNRALAKHTENLTHAVNEYKNNTGKHF